MLNFIENFLFKIDLKVVSSEGFKQGGLGAGVTNLNWDRWTAFNGNNPIVQTYWTAEHNIGNGSTNGDHYELGKYNADGSNLNTYPAVYRGILNFFGDSTWNCC